VTRGLSEQRIPIADMTVGNAYRIVVDGEFGGWLSHYVGDATIKASDGVTTIGGSVQDPNEFRALTETLCDLGLEIASATLI
jgi:hypothetical protein